MAQWKAQQAAKRPKTAKLAGNQRLRDYVQDRLAGSVRRPDGTIVVCPTPPPWKGLNKPHRQDRRWSTAWSPQQISHRLKVDFPDDQSMRISHEAIYQSLFIQGRGALERELVACLCIGRALRQPRARSQNGRRATSPPMSSSPSGQPRQPTGRSQGTERETSSSGPAGPRSAPWSSGAAAPPSWCTCHGWRAGVRTHR